MLHSLTNSQVLSADGEMLLRLVKINGVPCWQASDGRTFPQIAGAEDPPTAPKTEDPPKPKTGEGEGTGTGDDDFDKPRALATIKKLRDTEKSLKDQLKELETLKAKQKALDDAEKSEADRLKEQVAESERKREAAEQKLTEQRNRHALERAATKAGLADPDDVRLLDSKDFEHDADGALTNADELVKALLKAKPYLAGKQTSTNGVPGTPRGSGPADHNEKVKTNQDILRGLPDRQPL